MSDAVYWILDLAVIDGQLDNFRSLMGEMVASTEKEPGALNYEWSISQDGQTVSIYERYADSAAVMTHLGTFGANFAERFLACVDPTRFVVYGRPDATVKEALAGFSPAYMEEFGGFAR